MDALPSPPPPPPYLSAIGMYLVNKKKFFKEAWGKIHTLLKIPKTNPNRIFFKFCLVFITWLHTLFLL